MFIVFLVLQVHILVAVVVRVFNMLANNLVIVLGGLFDRSLLFNLLSKLIRILKFYARSIVHTAM